MNKYIFKVASGEKTYKGYWIRVEIYKQLKSCMMYEGRMYIDTTLDIENLIDIFKSGKYGNENIRKLTKLEEQNNG